MSHESRDLMHRILDAIVSAADNGIPFADLRKLDGDTSSETPKQQDGEITTFDDDFHNPAGEVFKVQTSNKATLFPTDEVSDLKLWNLLASHPDVFVEEDGISHKLCLSEKTLPPSTKLRSRHSVEGKLSSGDQSAATSEPINGLLQSSAKRQEQPDANTVAERHSTIPNPSSVLGPNPSTEVPIPTDTLEVLQSPSRGSYVIASNTTAISDSSHNDVHNAESGMVKPSDNGNATIAVQPHKTRSGSGTATADRVERSSKSANTSAITESSTTHGAGDMSFNPSRTALQTPAKRRGRPPGRAKRKASATPEITDLNSGLSRTRGRPTKQTFHGVIFTSYDELQRQNGVPGVYFDIPAFEKGLPGIGGKRRTRLACFKSERLKTVPWMNGIEEIRSPAPIASIEGPVTAESEAGVKIAAESAGEEPRRKKIRTGEAPSLGSSLAPAVPTMPTEHSSPRPVQEPQVSNNTPDFPSSRPAQAPAASTTPGDVPFLLSTQEHVRSNHPPREPFLDQVQAPVVPNQPLKKQGLEDPTTETATTIQTETLSLNRAPLASSHSMPNEYSTSKDAVSKTNLLALIQGSGHQTSGYKSPYKQPQMPSYQSPYKEVSTLPPHSSVVKPTTSTKPPRALHTLARHVAASSNTQYRSPYLSSATPSYANLYKSPYSLQTTSQPGLLQQSRPAPMATTENIAKTAKRPTTAKANERLESQTPVIAGSRSSATTGLANADPNPSNTKDSQGIEPRHSVTVNGMSETNPAVKARKRPKKVKADEVAEPQASAAEGASMSVNADFAKAKRRSKKTKAKEELAAPNLAAEEKLAREREAERLSIKMREAVERHAQETELAAKLEAEKATLAVALSVDLPGIEYRLAVSKEGVLGNLYLSADKRSVEFLAAEANSAMHLVFPVAEISINPTTSSIGSAPMEFRLSVNSGNDTELVHRFRFLSSNEAFQAANALRAKIVTAMIIEHTLPRPVPADEPEISAEERPFKCEKCGGSWKNLEGIRYHTTRAKVPCNPNYRPPSQSRGPYNRRKIDRRLGGEGSDEDEVGHNDEIHEMADEELFSRAARGEDYELYQQSDLYKSQAFNRGKSTATSSPRNIILSLLDGNNGVFPGDKGLWHAVLAVSMRKEIGLPSHETVRSALRSLIDSGTVQKIEFSFKCPPGGMVWSSIITYRNTDPHSTEVWALKENIKETAPEYFVPAAAASPSDVQGALKAFESGSYDLNGSNAVMVANPARILAHLQESNEESETSPKRRSSRRVARPVTYAVRDPETGESRSTIRRKAMGPSPMVSFSLDRSDSSDGYEDGALASSSTLGQRGNYPQTWQTASAYLQELDGSWNSAPHVPKRRSKYYREQMPEPVTYLQTWQSSAWAFRPFGHGAWPIYARSSKRTDSSTLLALESNFRPVFASKKRLLGTPATPNKFLTSIRDTPFSMSRSRKIRSSITSDQNFDPSPKRARRRRRQSRRTSQLSDGAFNSNWLDSTLDFKPLSMGDNATNPGLDSLPSQIRFNSLLTWPERPDSGITHSDITFLAPNTCLGENTEAMSHSPRNESVTVAFEPATGDLKPLFVRFVDAKTLQGRKGTWDIMDQTSFECETSWTLRGWFPSAKYILEQSLPTNMYELLAHKLGPPVVAESHPSPQWARFLSEVETVASWEQSEAALLCTGSVAPDYIFINHTTTVLEYADTVEPVSLLWNDEHSFTLENLPYSILRGDHDHERTLQATQVEVGKNTSGRTKSPIRRNPRRKRKLQPLYAPKIRRHANLPEDLRGVPQDLAKQLKASEIAHNHIANAGRKRTLEGAMTPEHEARLMVTVTVIRTLTGGLDKTVDWVLVTTFFPEFSMAYTKHRWTPLSRIHRDIIDQLSTDFQSLFLELYERGEIPHLDFDNLLDYDWRKLIDITMPLLKFEPTREAAPGLSSSRSEMNQKYDIKELAKKSSNDVFYDSKVPLHKRVIVSTAEQFTTPIPYYHHQFESGITEIEKARSWVRACTLTADERYDETHATRSLSVFPKKTVEMALNALLSSKILIHKNKGRPTPGRGFDIGESFHASLRKHLTQQHFIHACKFKERLDEAFRNGGKVEVEWLAEEGEVLAITNMQAAGRVKLEASDVPAHKFGVKTLDGYQSKRMDKSKLRFSMSIVPTASYIYNEDIEVTKIIFDGKHDPPSITEGALPVWIDLRGNLMRALWRLVVVATLCVMSLRPGMLAKDVARLMRPAMEEWEVRILIEWLVQVGALETLADGLEGWNVLEWWWLIAGKA